MKWIRRRPNPEDNDEVREAMQVRDEVLSEARKAIRTVDRLQASIIAEYAAAERLRLRRLNHP